MGDFELNILDKLHILGMLDPVLTVLKIAGLMGLVALIMAGLIAMLGESYKQLTLPFRRAERARMFLDLVDTTLKQGRPLEETIISLANSRDESMGVQFHQLAAWLEQGLPLDEALTRVPQFLPRQANAMVHAGRQIGDISKVLPATRYLLTDATSQSRGALNYLGLMSFITSPLGCGILVLLTVFVSPRFLEVFAGLGVTVGTGLAVFLYTHLLIFIGVHVGVLFLFWATSGIYFGESPLAARLRLWERLYYHLPWRRKRMQRDFSTMLAILLDSGVPEATALTLAADCSANYVFRGRATRAVAALRQGLKLPEAVQKLDDTGEFRWRLRNAVVAPGGFIRALAGWHESLDAHAFQQEQAAAHVITTALVLWTGLFVGLIISSMFMMLTSLITTATLW